MPQPDPVQTVVEYPTKKADKGIVVQRGAPKTTVIEQVTPGQVVTPSTGGHDVVSVPGPISGNPGIPATVTTGASIGSNTVTTVNAAAPNAPKSVLHNTVEVSPAARLVAENRVRHVLVDERTPVINKEEIAKSPVESIQKVVKESQKRAQELLSKEEERAKEEIDEIVKIKKNWDEMSEADKKKEKEKEVADKKNAAANEAKAALTSGTLKKTTEFEGK